MNKHTADKPITAEYLKQWKRDIIAWYISRPVYSMITGKLIGYIKLTINRG